MLDETVVLFLIRNFVAFFLGNKITCQEKGEKKQCVSE